MRSRLNGELISEEELTTAYRKAREWFLGDTPEEKRQLINLYLDKVVVLSSMSRCLSTRSIYERIMITGGETAEENKNSHNSDEVVRKSVSPERFRFFSEQRGRKIPRLG